ncbi:MAG: phenylacetate--CoA ligase [Candidatus Bathyarchaeia archaeon]
MSKSELQALQFKRLKRMLRYVYENSPFYKRKFDAMKVKPDDLRSLDDIVRFPFTTKEDLRLNAYPYGGAFLCVPREQIICWHMTSGTTGTPTIAPYTYKDYEVWMNVMARSYTAAGVRPGDIVMNIYGYGLFTGGIGFHQSAHLVGASVIPWSVGRTEALIKTMRDYHATVMTGTPSYQYYIAEKVKEMGLDPEKDLALRVTIPGAEMWTELMRKRLEEEFALKKRGGGARDVYGSTEMTGPGVGQECIYENGFHFWADHWYLEIIDPKTLEPVEPGEEGEMVFTHLTREGMPLIRYRIGDLTILDDEPCECGRKAFPRCKRIRGRTDDVIHFKGVKVFPSAVQEALFKFPEIKEYQIIVDRTKSLHDMIIKVEVSPYPSNEKSSSDLKEKVERELANIIFVRPTVEIVSPGTLPRYEGKSKRVVLKEPTAC